MTTWCAAVVATIHGWASEEGICMDVGVSWRSWYRPVCTCTCNGFRLYRHAWYMIFQLPIFPSCCCSILPCHDTGYSRVATNAITSTTWIPITDKKNSSAIMANPANRCIFLELPVEVSLPSSSAQLPYLPKVGTSSLRTLPWCSHILAPPRDLLICHPGLQEHHHRHCKARRLAARYRLPPLWRVTRSPSRNPRATRACCRDRLLPYAPLCYEACDHTSKHRTPRDHICPHANRISHSVSAQQADCRRAQKPLRRPDAQGNFSLRELPIWPPYPSYHHPSAAAPIEECPLSRNIHAAPLLFW